VCSEEGLDDMLELEVIEVEEDVGNDKERVADGEEKDLVNDEV
jgi:hypothetical protein